jgi:pyruvate/2-oxoglutarate/acetoin dehydrogenase E1 component/TPP-dependent pyruvate/acetoin dehydrogenase alpha subunit
MINNRELETLLEKMMELRCFEEKIAKLYSQGDSIIGPVHLYTGQEAVAVGVCSNLRQDDYMISNHRGHGHCLAKGATFEEMMSELHGKESGYNKGRGSSMHIMCSDLGIVGTSSVVASGIPIAAGIGLSIKMKKTDQVVVSFFGDGASNNGSFHEGLNMAALWKLPTIFVCENNLYAVSTSTSESTSVKDISVRGAAYGIPSVTINGMNVAEVAKVTREAVERARKGAGPTLIECKTYRFMAHGEGETLEYRTKEEIQKWKQMCPIDSLSGKLIKEKVLTEEKVKHMEQKIRKKIDEAAKFAKESSFPQHFIKKADVQQESAIYPASSPTKEITFIQAIREALREEMRRDETVFLLGEDIRHALWGVTKGLVDEFGRERVIDTPISENGIIGVALGSALTGLRPVVEIMFADFLTLCMDQIVNQAAKVRFLSGDQMNAPMVIRSPLGLGRSAGPQHSQSFISWFMHVPGIKIAAPSNSRDAKGLLKTAIRQNDPVIFIEALLLYGSKSLVPEEEYTIPFGKADVKKEGKDVTLVAISTMVPKAITACENLAKKGVDVELIDPRTLSPLDKDTIIDSVKKTTRLVIAEPECKTAGIGAEIAAIVAEEAIDYLDAPIKRVAIPDSCIPCSPSLEKIVIPNEEDIIKTILEIKS